MLNYKKFIFRLSLAGYLCLLSACGFHLRGAIKLSSELSPVYVQDNTFFDLARDLKDLLRSDNITVVKQADNAKMSLVLLNETKGERVLSVDASGRAHEYLLNYKVHVQFKGRYIKPVNDSITLTRTLLFDPDAVLAATNEQATLYKEMQHEAAVRILLKLQSLSEEATANATVPVKTKK